MKRNPYFNVDRRLSLTRWTTLYRAKKNALSWVFGLFGGSGEEQEVELKDPALCKISGRDDRCLNLVNGRVGEFL